MRFKNWSIRWKILSISLLGLLLVSVILAVFHIRDISTESRRAMIEKSRAIVLNVESVRQEMERKWDYGLFTTEMLLRFEEEGRQDKILASIPVVTAWNSAMMKAEEGNYRFKVPKVQPRNPANEPDPTELEVLEKFKNEGLEEYYLIDEEMNAIRYFRPVILSETCLYCHGDPERSEELWNNSRGIDPTGGTMENWDVGEVHGAFEVISSLDPVDERMVVTARTVSLTALLVFLAVLVTISLVVRAITRPLQRCVDLAYSVRDGDLQLQIEELRRGDEVGKLVSAFRQMLGELQKKAGYMERIAEGDLTERIERASARDQLGGSLIAMKESLHSILYGVATAIRQVSAGSDQVSSSSQTLAQGATEQASSVQEVTESLAAVNRQAQENTSSSTQAKEQALKAKEEADRGSEQMRQLEQAMTDITGSSQEISRIAKVIDDIAFQINILSLNANVEAARAGSHGKGFAVVAEEVRNLAMKSAEAVDETYAMVKRSSKSIEGGNTIVREASAQLSEIVSSSQQLADILSEIADSSRQQSASLDEMTTALQQIDEVTQSNAASAEESAAAAEELSGQSEELKSLIGQFRFEEAEQRPLIEQRRRDPERE
jgi:methyl-accepting chemotaxis protein